ncbi:MAG: HAD family hydrolase [Candidatus Paceibacterota bacterium]
MTSEIKLIIFDLGGTVFSKGKQAFIDLLSEKLGIAREQVVAAVDGLHALKYRRSEISAADYWEIVKSQLAIPPDGDDLETIWFDQYAPLPGMQELLAQLRSKYKLAYLSNNTPERVAYLQKKYNFLDWFDDGLFSYEIGTVKSDGGMIQQLMEKFKNVAPKETILIDDRTQNLTEPASLGFITVTFEDAKQLCSALKEKRVRLDTPTSARRVAGHSVFLIK